jgi:hypothetical protein
MDRGAFRESSGEILPADGSYVYSLPSQHHDFEARPSSEFYAQFQPPDTAR